MFHGVALRRVPAPGALGTADARELQPAKAAASGRTPRPLTCINVALPFILSLFFIGFGNLARNPRCREKNMSILARAATLLALLLLSFVPAKAETWPNRPIKIIVSQAAGGTPDLICRLISDKLSDLLGQRVVVENRPGGGNVVGAAAAAHAAADGYTLFFATAAPTTLPPPGRFSTTTR